MVKVVMAGGGTAGHVNPLLATAAQLRDGKAMLQTTYKAIREL